MKKLVVALSVLVFVTAFALPATARDKGEVTFGGSVRFDTWVHHDRLPDLDLDGDGLFDDGRYKYNNTTWTLDTSSSRFNATFKRDDFKGFIEVRPRPGSTIGIRHWYGEWDFGPGYLLIGQTYFPTYSSISKSAAGNSAGFNTTVAGDTANAASRRPMIRLRFPFPVGEFQFAAVDPNTAARTATAAGGLATTRNTSLPQLEAKVSASFGPVGFNLFGNYNKYKEVWEDLPGDNTINTTEIGVKSWVVGSNVKFTGGPFTLALAGFTGKNNNGANGWFSGATDRGLLSPVIVDSTGDGLWDSVQNTKDRGAYINATFKLNDMLSFATGGGMMKQKRDDNFIGTANDEVVNKSSHMYINSTIKIAEGFTITPEIGEWDHKTSTLDNNVTRDMGKTTYYGIYWRMNF